MPPSAIQPDMPTRARFERVADLVEGFETPFGLELLATVHWIVNRDDVKTADDVVSRTYAWGERKLMFSESQLRLALDRLNRGGWVQALRAAPPLHVVKFSADGLGISRSPPLYPSLGHTIFRALGPHPAAEASAPAAPICLPARFC